MSSRGVGATAEYWVGAELPELRTRLAGPQESSALVPDPKGLGIGELRAMLARLKVSQRPNKPILSL